MNVPLKNIQNQSGKYALYFLNKSAQWQRVEKTGFATKPFQVVATFANRPYVAVQKIGNVHNENDMRLFLINLRDGSVVDGCEFGASRVVFDINNKSIFFTPLASNGVPTKKYSWCLPLGDTPYMAINVPSKLEPNIQAWYANTESLPVVNMAVVEFVPRTVCATNSTDLPKRKRGRPRGSKNKSKLPINKETPLVASVKRKRGRPRGSKNKPKTLPNLPTMTKVATKPQVRKNIVSMRNIKRNTLGGLYDVYINGIRVATKRLNANAKTFMNNRILAVSYRVPAGLSNHYDIFWPNGAQFYVGGAHRLTGAPITINSVSEHNGELKLELSNRATRVIRENDLARFIPAEFILSEKQR